MPRASDYGTRLEEQGDGIMNNVLIVVDMLNDFVDEEEGILSFRQARAIVPAVKRRLALHRADGSQIIYLCDAHAEDDLEFLKFPAHAIKNTWGADIIDELEPKKGDTILPKTRYSGFYGTPLEAHLAVTAPKKVEVVGVCTSICVMDTVGGLANRDYNVYIHENCVADFSDEAHTFSIVRMKSLYGAKIIEGGLWP